MNILHFILGKANPDRANGVNQVINGLVKHQTSEGHTVYVLGLSKTDDGQVQTFERDGFKVEVYPSFFRGGYDRLKELSREVDIVHLHGVWNHYNLILGRYLRQINQPYIVSTHAGLAEDRLRQSNYRLKKLYHNLFQHKLFDGAAGIHAITREETTDVAKYTDNDNIFLVPNGVEIDKYPFLYKPKDNALIKVCYLGRLSIEKNIKNLIIAFSKLTPEIQSNIKLCLVGPKNNSSKVLENLVENLDLQNIVEFHGGVYGSDKIELLSQMDFYIHPAYSDVVSIAAIEAMAIGLPSIITRTSHVSYYQNRNAFIMVEPTVKDLEEGITEMIGKRDKWTELSTNARTLVEDVFNWEVSAKYMLNEYNKILK